MSLENRQGPHCASKSSLFSAQHVTRYSIIDSGFSLSVSKVMVPMSVHRKSRKVRTILLIFYLRVSMSSPSNHGALVLVTLGMDLAYIRLASLLHMDFSTLFYYHELPDG